MKIAQIKFDRINNALGGTEKVFLTMASAMVKRGHSVGCFYYDTTIGEPTFPVNPQVYLNNCCNGFRSKFRKFLSRIHTGFVLDRNKRHKIRISWKNDIIIKNVLAFKPDVILLYWPHPIIYKLNQLDIPVIQMIHMAPTYFEKDSNFIASRDGLEKCDCIQVLMPEYRQELYQFIKNENIVYIPNIVPQYTVQSELTSPVIIFLGRIVEQKRPWLIVEAFALLKDRYPDWRVELWGEQDLEPHITDRVTRLIQRYGLEDRVLLCGTTLDVSSKLKQASILLMPSSHEGFSLALTEGMSMGLPVIACRDCPALDTLVHNGENGFLCEASPEDIASKLAQLMDSLECRKRLGHQAKEDMKQYHPDLVYDRWEELMSEVVEKRNISHRND